MSDANPSETPKNTGPDAIDEREVERILDQAAGLTGQLADEMGAEPVVPGSIGDLSGIEDNSPTIDVEACLDDVEARLKSFTEESGTGSAEAPVGKTHPSSSTDPAQVESKDVEARGELTPPVPGRKTRSNTTVQPAVRIASGKHREPPASAGAAPHHVDGAIAGRESPVRHPTPSAGLVSRLRRIVMPVLWVIDCLVEWMVVFVLRVLDILDGAFSFINYDVRKILGWVALAMIVAACAIAASSMS